MKIYSSSFRVVLASLSAATVCLASSPSALADTTNTFTPPSSGPMTTAMTPGLPFGVSEVVKMYQGGIGKDVIVNYINNAILPFHLSADNIIYLQSLGMPQDITKAIILRDGQLQQQASQFQQYQQQMQQQQMQQQQMGINSANGAATGAQGQVAMPSTPPPSVDYPYDYGDAGYPYTYPYYPYGYGGVVVGGWPWWGGGFRGGFYPGFRGGFGGFRGGVGGFHGGFGGGFHGGGGFGGHGGGGGHR